MERYDGRAEGDMEGEGETAEEGVRSKASQLLVKANSSEEEEGQAGYSI